MKYKIHKYHFNHVKFKNILEDTIKIKRLLN